MLSIFSYAHCLWSKVHSSLLSHWFSAVDYELSVCEYVYLTLLDIVPHVTDIYYSFSSLPYFFSCLLLERLCFIDFKFIDHFLLSEDPSVSVSQWNFHFWCHIFHLYLFMVLFLKSIFFSLYSCFLLIIWTSYNSFC